MYPAQNNYNPVYISSRIYIAPYTTQELTGERIDNDTVMVCGEKIDVSEYFEE
jgi:hypothetical protein